MTIPYPKSILVILIIIIALLFYAYPTGKETELFDAPENLEAIQAYVDQRYELVTLPQPLPVYLPIPAELSLQDEISPQCDWQGVTLDRAEQLANTRFIYAVWLYDGLCGGGLNRMTQAQSNNLPQFTVDVYYIDAPGFDICVLMDVDIERAYVINEQSITRLSTNSFDGC